MRYLFIILFIAIACSAVSQKDIIKPENGDCDHPIVLTDTIFGLTNPPKGPGRLMEISGTKSSIFWFEKEHNTVWYKIPIQLDCELSFDIIPEFVDDDYDFLLFRYTENLCMEILNKAVKPVRTNISRNNEAIESRTGLSPSATEEFLHSGPGEDYSKSIEVKKGEVYYLVLDNVYNNGGGHTIDFSFRDCKYARQKMATLDISVIDSKTKEKLDASIIISIESDTLFSENNTSSASYEIQPNSYYAVEAKAPGYFSNLRFVRTSDKTEDVSEVIELTKIETGTKVTLENLYFYGGTPNFLPESFPVLKSLLATMQENPNLKIEILGHVNHPYNARYQRSTQSLLLLSQQRANAVYNYLTQRGIESQRIKTKGCSNLKMIYPYATTEEEMAQNRRVEIVVVGK